MTRPLMQFAWSHGYTHAPHYWGLICDVTLDLTRDELVLCLEFIAPWNTFISKVYGADAVTWLDAYLAGQDAEALCALYHELTDTPDLYKGARNAEPDRRIRAMMMMPVDSEDQIR